MQSFGTHRISSQYIIIVIYNENKQWSKVNSSPLSLNRKTPFVGIPFEDNECSGSRFGAKKMKTKKRKNMKGVDLYDGKTTCENAAIFLFRNTDCTVW